MSRTERKWHSVKLKKTVRRTELDLSATLSEMKGDFDKIISFHLSVSAPPPHSSWRSRPFRAPPFHLTSHLLSIHFVCVLPFSLFFSLRNGPQKTHDNPTCSFAFHYKNQQESVEKDIGGITFLPHPPGASELNKKRKRNNVRRNCFATQQKKLSYCG